MTECFSSIAGMDCRQFIVVFAFGLIAGVLSNEEEAEGVISTPTSKTFYPFGLNYWLGFPYQAWQWWFPYFRPYHPSKPLTWGGSKPGDDCDSKPQTQNIFGISDPPGEDVEYLPPADEIDWGFDDFVPESM